MGFKPPTGTSLILSVLTTGTLILSGFIGGRILFTDTAGNVTSTAAFTYTTSTDTLNVQNLSISGTCTGCTGSSMAFADGTAALPSISFASDTDTGLHRISANHLGISAGGSDILGINATSVRAYQQFFSPALNSSTAPNYALSSPTTGFYAPTLNTAALTLNGSVSVWFRDDYNVYYDGAIPTSNNSLDNGIPGNAWRNISASSTVFTNKLSAQETTSTVGYFTTLKSPTVSSTNITTDNIYGRDNAYINIYSTLGAIKLDGQQGIHLGGTDIASIIPITVYENILPDTDYARSIGQSNLALSSVFTYNIYGGSTDILQIDTDNALFVDADQGITMRTADGGSGQGINVTSTAVEPINNNAITFGSSGKIWSNGYFTTLNVGGNAFPGILSASTISFGDATLLAGGCTSTATTVTGATTAMQVDVTPVTYPGDAADWKAYVSAADTVTTKVCGLVATTPTASVYRIRVTK